MNFTSTLVVKKIQKEYVLIKNDLPWFSFTLIGAELFNAFIAFVELTNGSTLLDLYLLKPILALIRLG